MSFDIYSRTSLPIHHQTSQQFFKSYYDQGLLNEKKIDAVFMMKKRRCFYLTVMWKVLVHDAEMRKRVVMNVKNADHSTTLLN